MYTQYYRGTITLGYYRLTRKLANYSIFYRKQTTYRL